MDVQGPGAVGAAGYALTGPGAGSIAAQPGPGKGVAERAWAADQAGPLPGNAQASRQGVQAAGLASSTGTPPLRLVKAAHEFEAQMMKELMGPLTHGSLFGSDEADEGDDQLGGSLGSSGALGEFASEALAQALSEKGGFGMATSILKKLSAHGAPGQGNQIGKDQVTGIRHGNTVLNPSK